MSTQQCIDLCTQPNPSKTTLLHTACSFNNTSFASCQDACLLPSYQFTSCMTITGCDRFSFSQDSEQSGHDAYPTCNETYANIALGMFNECMDQYCADSTEDNELGGCQPQKVSFSPTLCGGGSASNPKGVLTNILTMSDPQTAGVCKSLVRTVNPDIGGIGVFTAYVFQISLVAYVLIGLSFVSFIRNSLLPRRRKILIGQPTDTEKPTTQLRQPHSKRMKVSRNLRNLIEAQFQVLKDTADNVQDAQCYLMIAGQIALLRAIYAQVDQFDATSFYQLENNYLLAVLISESTVLPVGILFGALRYIGDMTVYAQLVSWATIILSVITFVSTIRKDPQGSLLLSRKPPVLTNVTGLNKFASCGYNNPPVVYCSPDYDHLISTFTAVWIVSMILPFIWLCRSLKPVVRKLSSKYLGSRGYSYLNKKSPRELPPTFKTLIDLVKLLEWPLLFAGYIVVMTFPIQIFINLKRNGATDVRGEAWSISQIIAAMVFAPIVLKYLYYTGAMLWTYAYERFDSNSPKYHEGADREKTAKSETHHERHSRVKGRRVFGHHPVTHRRYPHHQHPQNTDYINMRHDHSQEKDVDPQQYSTETVLKKRHEHHGLFSRLHHMFSMDSSWEEWSSDEEDAGHNNDHDMKLIISSSENPALSAAEPDGLQPGDYQTRRGRPTGHSREPSHDSIHSNRSTSNLVSGAARPGASTPLLGEEDDGLSIQPVDPLATH